MKRPEYWRVLLEKAAEDEFTADLLLERPESSDGVIGFHLQQAAEKLLKALLASKGVQYRYTHNLGELIHLVTQSGEEFSAELEAVRELTPFATELRYDFIPAEGDEGFDRAGKRKLVSLLRRWVEEHIRE